MSTQRESGYSDNLGLRFLREQADEGHFIFTLKEAMPVASRLGISEPYLRELLSRLVAGNWLIRLRNGLYAGTGTLPGGGEIHSFAIATHLVTPSAISHWSAMSYHGLTEQIPQVVTAFTPKRFMTPDMRTSEKQPSRSKQAWEIDGVRYEFTITKPEFYFGIQEVWIDQNFKVPITDKERTMLEGFASPRFFGGMGEILGILNEHFQEFDLQKLVSYSVRYGKAAVVKRLGWALEREGAPANVLAPLEQFPTSGYRILDPTRPRSGPYDSSWMIQDNLSPGNQ